MTNAVLERVLAHPDDLAMRAVYADALMAAGDPRGEYVQTSIALLGKLTPDAREAVSSRAKALFAEHGASWTSAATGWAELRMRAGFVEAISCTARAFFEHARGLFDVEPVRTVRLRDATDEDLVALAAHPLLARARKLALIGPYGDSGIAALAQSVHVASLVSLNATCSAEGCAALARGRFEKLEKLSLSSSDFGDEGAAAIAKSPRLATLESLYAARSEITDEGAAALAGGKASLQTLCLGGNEIGDDGAAAIAKGKSLASLRVLELNQTPVGDDGADAIASSKVLANLRRLDLRHSEVSLDAVQKLRSKKARLNVLASAW